MNKFASLIVAALAALHLFGMDGSPVLCVPEGALNPALMPFNDESTHLQPGGGHTPGFGVFFSLNEMRRRFGMAYHSDPAFGDNPALTGLSATISFVSAEDQLRLGPAMRARYVRDIWTRSGACPAATVQPLPRTLLFVAKCSAESDYGSLWDRAPDPKSEPPDPNVFVVATCNYSTISAGPYKGTEQRECRRLFIDGGQMVDYQFAEQNAPLIARFDAFFKEKIESWKRACSHAI